MKIRINLFEFTGGHMEIEMFGEKKYPYICTPLTGNSTSEILAELENIIPKNPDLIEWRVDFYNDIANVGQILATAEQIANYSEGLPILFTIRSYKEGGQKISLSEDEKVELLSEVCKSDYIDMVDFEVSNNPEHIKHLRAVSKEYKKKLILSYHNFEFTPEKSEILKRLLLAEFYGADAAKAAVMPQNEKDVSTLLDVTREANELLNIPVITMSMGQLGSVSRMLGWFYGSAVTFAIGEKSSAPGQISIEHLKTVIEMLKEPMGYKL
jgi:3-dehydroquinate dehydratase I